MKLGQKVKFSKSLSRQSGYGKAKARRFTINGTNQNCWIPIKHLGLDGTLKPNQDIDYVIMSNKRQFELAGVFVKFEVRESEVTK